MEEIPHRLSSSTGHGSATVAVSRRLLIEMYDEDVAVQSRRLEAMLRDAAQAKRLWTAQRGPSSLMALQSRQPCA